MVRKIFMANSWQICEQKLRILRLSKATQLLKVAHARGTKVYHPKKHLNFNSSKMAFQGILGYLTLLLTFSYVPIQIPLGIAILLGIASCINQLAISFNTFINFIKRKLSFFNSLQCSQHHLGNHSTLTEHLITAFSMNYHCKN